MRDSGGVRHSIARACVRGFTVSLKLTMMPEMLEAGWTNKHYSMLPHKQGVKAVICSQEVD